VTRSDGEKTSWWLPRWHSSVSEDLSFTRKKNTNLARKFVWKQCDAMLRMTYKRLESGCVARSTVRDWQQILWSDSRRPGRDSPARFAVPIPRVFWTRLQQEKKEKKFEKWIPPPMHTHVTIFSFRNTRIVANVDDGVFVLFRCYVRFPRNI